MIKTFVIDDYPLVREGLRQILGDTSDIEVEDESSLGEEALSKITKNMFDVVILHGYFSMRRGIDFLKKLKVINPELPVLVLSMKTEDDSGLRYLRAGASGCLANKCKPNELKGAIRELAKGKKYISPSLAEKIAFNMIAENGNVHHDSLSRREYQVMCLIASGKSVKEIADELSLSVKTISTVRARILKKMKWKNNAELTHYAIKRELVD